MAHTTFASLIESPTGVVISQPVGCNANGRELPGFRHFFRAMQSVAVLAEMRELHGRSLHTNVEFGEYTDATVEFFPFYAGDEPCGGPFLKFHWDALNDREAEEALAEYNATNSADSVNEMINFIYRYARRQSNTSTSDIGTTDLEVNDIVNAILMFVKRMGEGCYLSWSQSGVGNSLEVFLVPATRDAEYKIELFLPKK